MDRFYLSTNPTLIGKLKPAGVNGRYSKEQTALFTENLQAVEFTPDALIASLEAGKMHAVGHYRDGYRHADNFLRSSVFMSDIDGTVKEASATTKAVKYLDADEFQAVLALPFIQQYALVVIQSASSEPGKYKLRIVFLADQAITDPGEYAEISRWINKQLPHADHTHDPARFFFGGKPGKKADFINADNRLNIAAIRTRITADRAAEEKERQKFHREWQAPENSSDLYQQMTEALRFIPPHGDYNDWLSILLAIHDAFPGADGIALAEGWSAGYPGEVAQKFASFKDRSGDKITAATLFWMARKHGYRPQIAARKVAQILRDSDLLYLNKENQKLVESDRNFATLELPYISDYTPPEQGAILVKSPTGTGKTEWVKRMINRLPEGATVRYIAHRVLLVGNAANRLGLENYQSIPGGYDLGLFDRLAVCLNSLPRHKTIPELDLLVIDEVDQVLAALFDRTLRGQEAVNIHNILRHMIASAKTVICMDAYASEAALKWLSGIRPDAYTIENRPKLDKKPLTLWADSTAMLAELDRELLQPGDPILLACGLGQSKKLYERYSKLYGADAIRVINSENSSAASTLDFVNNINSQLSALRLLIYSPAMGTGVDITAPVRSVYAIFEREPHTAPDMLQQIGRARRAGKIHATMPLLPLDEPRETNRNVIALEEYRRAIQGGGFALRVLQDGTVSAQPTPEQRDLTNLQSDIIAQRNESFNYLLQDFVRLAAGQYAITTSDAAPDTAIKEDLKLTAEAVKEREKQQTLNATPISQEEYDHRIAQRTYDPDVDNYALERWKIEQFYSQQLTPELYDLWEGGKGRGRLLAFSDMVKLSKDVATRDKEDLAGALHSRKHYSKLRYMRRELLKTVWGVSLPAGRSENFQVFHSEAVTLDQINEGVAVFLEKHGADMVLFERRKVHSDDPLNLLRWVLRRVGLELEQIRNCADAGKYRITQDSLDTMIRLYNAREAAQITETPEELLAIAA